MIELLMTLFPLTNLIWFQGNWHTERKVGNSSIKIDSIVLHSFEIENPNASNAVLTYDKKDKTYVKSGSCANVLHYWSEAKIGAHYIISSESIQKITADLHERFTDLEQRAAKGEYATYVHSPQDITLVCCISDNDTAYHAGLSRFKNFGTFQKDKNRSTLNFSSIGIELQGNGFYENDKSHQNFDKFWPQQIEILERLINVLCDHHKLDKKRDILTHSTIAPLRKKDPGRYFPFKELADKGIGWVLPEPPEEKELGEQLSVESARKLLMAVGYQLPENIFSQLKPEERDEIRFGCLFNSSPEDIIWSTLDGFALQYAPWAWAAQEPGVLSLSEDARRRVLKALTLWHK